MSTEDERARRALAAGLPERDLFRLLSLFAELREVALILWPGTLLEGKTLDDIEGMLRAELTRRAAAKSAT